MIHFISDLHLSNQTQGINRLFRDYLSGPVRSASHLFILGDLFEAWPGDDCLEDSEDCSYREIALALRELGRVGVRLSVMHGNRDFLLGSGFANLSGCALLPDPYTLSADGWQIVMSHGDSLCTDDHAYQEFRKLVRDRAWHDSFLSKPLQERKSIAAELRRRSEETRRVKHTESSTLTDLNPAATEDFLRTHGYATFIHGHTHHPMCHDHIVDGIHVERWVLSGWSETCGDYLAWDGNQLIRNVIT